MKFIISIKIEISGMHDEWKTTSVKVSGIELMAAGQVAEQSTAAYK